MTDFAQTFEQLTGHAPFPWQTALYEQFLAGNCPSPCNLPTGLGKTSIIAIWLIALAEKAKVPRRLVYVVNRRTVVDQTTDEVMKYRERLQKNIPILKNLCNKLAALYVPAQSDESPLAISTLRGQFADNREWSANPTRPAVICGTVDLIGSRLLFSGYGIGFKAKPLHAGFLGQDSLLIHDEAHLEPAFQKLLETIVKEQNDGRFPENDQGRRLKVMELTATSRSNSDGFSLQPADHEHPVVQARVHANKKIEMHPIDDEKELPDRLTELALAHRDSSDAILVFARTVEAVEGIAKKLRKEAQQVETLTGTMRGLERDGLVCKPVFTRFLPEQNRPNDVEPAKGTVYLVCTSAGEVGVNISADHLVCDLTTFESMAQRFGRVNRFGERDDTRIDLVHPTTFGKEDKISPYDERRKKTLELLKSLNGDGSPLALGKLAPEDRAAAFTPEPVTLPATDILFDAWSLTTIRGQLPGRPPVEPYLHGIADDAPQTMIAWRDELDMVEKLTDTQAEKALQAIFTKHRIRPHETVTVGMTKQREKWKCRAIDFLEQAVKKHPEIRNKRVALIFDRGLGLRTVGELLDNEDLLLAEPTLVLPGSFGGLSNGMLSAEAVAAAETNQPQSAMEPGEDDASEDDIEVEEKVTLDVADHDGYERYSSAKTRLRILLERSGERWRALAIPRRNALPADWQLDESNGKSTKLVNEIRNKSGLAVRLVQDIAFDDEGEPTRCLVCLSPAPVQNQQTEQSLDDHVAAVKDAAQRIADSLKLAPPIRHALLFAAQWHDEGKKARLWQRYIGGPVNGVPLGKSAEWRNPKILAGYRHEFGSLLRISDAQATCDFSNPHLELTSEEQAAAKSLAQHLIAAHHGYARPHFANPLDIEFPDAACEAIHVGTMQRFARLQRTYGRWGLAWLESLLRAADGAASAAAGLDPETDDDDASEEGAET